jgi:hypothetical protein
MPEMNFTSVNPDGWARCRGCGKADRHVRSVLIAGKWWLLHYWCEPQFDESRLVRGRRPR